jgi:dihydroorotase
LEDFDTNYKVLPPLRTSKDSKELLKAVKNGTIDFVTCDHSPLNIELKKVEFDNADYGTIGLESSFGALNQLFSIEETIDILTRGREAFGIENPELKEGAKANLTLFDPTKEYIFTESHIESSSKNSLFIGHTLKGKVLGTIANNQVQLNE